MIKRDCPQERGCTIFAFSTRDIFLSRTNSRALRYYFCDSRQICLLRQKEGSIISIKVFISLKGKAVWSHKWYPPDKANWFEPFTMSKTRKPNEFCCSWPRGLKALQNWKFGAQNDALSFYCRSQGCQKSKAVDQRMFGAENCYSSKCFRRN